MLMSYQYLSDILKCLDDLSTVSIFFRFALATFCGSVIGFERGKKRHAAGLRTHILVCLGATAAMLVNQYIFVYLDPTSDPGRIGAQVISGIGFLGAGTIVITGHQRAQQVKGLTTAAGLWASACMGLLVGVGFYECALIMCAFLFIVIVVLNKLDERYLKTSSTLRVYLEYAPNVSPFSTILTALRNNRWHVTHIQYLNLESCSEVGVLLELQYNEKKATLSEDGIDAIRNLEGVLYVEDI